MIIKDNTNTQLVNQESQGTGPINGTIYIPQSKTPYTVTVTVTAGTEVAQYRICNISTLSEITLNTNVTTTDNNYHPIDIRKEKSFVHCHAP